LGKFGTDSDTILTTFLSTYIIVRSSSSFVLVHKGNSWAWIAFQYLQRTKRRECILDHEITAGFYLPHLVGKKE